MLESLKGKCVLSSEDQRAVSFDFSFKKYIHAASMDTKDFEELDAQIENEFLLSNSMAIEGYIEFLIPSNLVNVPCLVMFSSSRMKVFLWKIIAIYSSNKVGL